MQVVLHIEMAMRAAEYATEATEGATSSSNALAAVADPAGQQGGGSNGAQRIGHQSGDGEAAGLVLAGRPESDEHGLQRWFMLGVRLALREGGCCASRAAYVGACLGAWLGPEAVPEHWLQRCLLRKELEGGAEAVCRSRD